MNMDLTMILLRCLHIFGAVFWAGTVFLMVSFLMPAAAKAGPAGGAFMQTLMSQTKLMVAMPMTALVTILSGFVLYWKNMAGMGHAWAASATGMIYGVGAIAGIVALALGATSRPAGMRMAALAKEIEAGGGTPTPAQAAEVATLQARMDATARWGAWLMALALLTMVSARHIYL